MIRLCAHVSNHNDPVGMYVKLLEQFHKFGCRHYWCDDSTSAHASLGLFLARLGKEVEHTKIYVSTQTHEGITTDQLKSYLRYALNDLRIQTFDYLMLSTQFRAVKRIMDILRPMQEYIKDSKLAYGVGVYSPYLKWKASAHKFKALLQCIAAETGKSEVIDMFTESFYRDWGHRALFKVSSADNQEIVKRIARLGVTLTVDIVKEPSSYIEQVVLLAREIDRES